MACVCKVFARAAAGAVGCSEGETGWRLCHDELREVMALRVGYGRDPDSCDFRCDLSYNRGSSIGSERVLPDQAGGRDDWAIR